jgi:hypothetical protein
MESLAKPGGMETVTDPTAALVVINVLIQTAEGPSMATTTPGDHKRKTVASSKVPQRVIRKKTSHLW